MLLSNANKAIRLKVFRNVLNYGAIGDGVTVSLTNIQNYEQNNPKGEQNADSYSRTTQKPSNVL